MRAAILRDQRIVVDEIGDPVPGPGHVLVRTLACGICGSDLHAIQHGPTIAAAGTDDPVFGQLDFKRDLVMGHEFCAEILDFGPETARRLKPGSQVCSLPVVSGPDWRQTVGYSNLYPGGYGELMVLNENLLLAVPEGLPATVAAMTEPMAVGYHAVQRARLESDDVPLVIGCGPVGLAVIWALKKRGLGPVVASDFSPLRRRLAERLGADVVVDPAMADPHEVWRGQAAAPGDETFRPALNGAGALRPAVIFECVGVPGVIRDIIRHAPRDARVVVVGVCMEEDRFSPYQGILKEINLQFVLGYTPVEFSDTLIKVAEGRTDVEALITGEVGLDQVADAFVELASPDTHAKIVVKPNA